MSKTLLTVENRRIAISDMPYTKLYIHSSGLSEVLSFVTSRSFSCCCRDVVCVNQQLVINQSVSQSVNQSIDQSFVVLKN